MLRQNRVREIAMALVAVVSIATAILLASPAVSGNRQAVWVMKAILSPRARPGQLNAHADVPTGPSAEMSVLAEVVVGNASDAEGPLHQLLASGGAGESSRLWAFRLLRVGAALRDFAAAEGAFNLATKIAPNEAPVWYEQASFYEAHGQLDNALAAYRAGYQADPLQAAHGYLRSGIILYRLGKYVEALAMLDQSAAADSSLPQLPDWARGMLYFYMGDSHKRLRDWNASLAAFEKVLTVSPSEGWPRYAAYAGMGDIWLATGNLEQSRQAYESALHSAGNDVNRSIAQKALGAWYRQAGDPSRAVLAYQQAIRLNPTDPWAYTDLGQAYEGLHRPDLAAAQYREALRVEPQMTFAKRALERLGAGDAGNN